MAIINLRLWSLGLNDDSKLIRNGKLKKYMYLELLIHNISGQ